MRFSLEQLEAFTAAVEAGSFSGAARKLGKAQSRISTAIANLEVDLGVVLFDRTGKLPVLTEAGEDLLYQATEILGQCHGLLDQADRLAEGEQSLIRIAIDELLPASVMADVLEEFSIAFPRTGIDVLWGAMGDVTTMVTSGRADVGIDMPVADKPDSRCGWKVLANTDFCCAATPEHPLALIKGITRKDLSQHRQLLPVSREGSSLLEEYRFSERVWQCEDSRLIVELMRRGLGWSMVPRYQIADELRQGTLVELAIPLSEAEISHSFFYIWNRHRLLTEAEEWLAEQFTNRLHPLCSRSAD